MQFSMIFNSLIKNYIQFIIDMITFDDENATFDATDKSFDGYDVIFRILTETLGLSDAHAKFIVKIISEIIGTAENIFKSLSKILTEIVGTAENTIKTITRNLLEMLSLSDFSSKGIVKLISDSVSFAEKIGKFRFISDIVGMIEHLTKSITRQLLDTISLSVNKIRRFINGMELIWKKIFRTVSTAYTTRTKPDQAVYTKRAKPTTDWEKRDKPWAP